MAYIDNRPPVDRLRRMLADIDLSVYADTTFQELLDASIAYVEDVATTRFNGISTQVALANEAEQPGFECYDGNGTNRLMLRKRPALYVYQVQVHTPILGYTRVYQPTEVKLYRKQGELMIFTYKLAVEQALFNTLDYQAWGTIFPPLPKAVQVQYAYGFPQYDPAADTTTVDGGTTVFQGDLRDPEETNWLTNLQQAAECDAAASFLAQIGSLKTGVVQSVSFDGYSRSMSPSPYQATIEGLIGKRDELLKRRRRLFAMATVG